MAYFRAAGGGSQTFPPSKPVQEVIGINLSRCQVIFQKLGAFISARIPTVHVLSWPKKLFCSSVWLFELHAWYRDVPEASLFSRKPKNNEALAVFGFLNALCC